MNTDFDPDITPIYGPPPSVEEQARGQAAQDRPRPHAPIVESHHLDVLDDSLYHAFIRARDLFHIRSNSPSAVSPADDVEYPRLKPHLITLAGRWSRALQDDPNDDELADLLAELRRYLPKHDRGAHEAAPDGIVMRARMRVVESNHVLESKMDVLCFQAIGHGDHPSGMHVDLSMVVVNPSLVGRFRPGQTFDVLFTEIPPDVGAPQ